MPASTGSSPLGLHIMDPRILSDQVGDDDDDDDDDDDHHHTDLRNSPSTLRVPVALSAPPRSSSRPSTMSFKSVQPDSLYSNLATFTFGEATTSADDEPPDSISPLTLTNRPAVDHTPRQSVSVSQHSPTVTDDESSEDLSSPDLLPQRGRNHTLPDNASQHTFGQPTLRFSTASITSSRSRSSSRASSRSDLQFSSDDEVEIAYFDGGSSPGVIYRDLDNIDENTPAFHQPLYETRRGSLPMAIPGASSDTVSNRSREDSILTIRRPSRSLDDDLASHLSSHSTEDPAAVIPRSEPLTRADFRSLEVQAVQQQIQQVDLTTPERGVLTEFDLSYVLSRKSEGSIRSFRSTAQLSFVRRTSTAEASSSRLSNSWLSAARRTSTITLTGEDSFHQHIGQYDPRADQWSFSKEKSDNLPANSLSSARHGRPSSLVAPPINLDRANRTMFPGTQEIWRSRVGRYRVDRLTFKPTADPAKAAQQRIHVRHIPEPIFKGSRTSGPTCVVHKHSRAIAFSIFRSYSLLQPKRGGASAQSGSRNIHIHMSGAIMLAPKKVQEQYTSTKTTSKLSTHGLLEDGSRKPGGSAGRRGAPNLSFLEKEKRREKDKAKVKEKKKDKKNEKLNNPVESTESSTTTSSGGSVNIPPSPVVRAMASKISFAPPMGNLTTIVKLRPTSGPPSPVPSSLLDNASLKKIIDERDLSAPIVVHNRGHRDSVDSDERLPTRTPHAEAFGTLDPNDIEHLRRSQKPSDGSSSFANRIFRRLRGASSRPDSSGSVPAVTAQNAYSPPWIVTAGRDQNEEHVRVLTDLNNSFRDVGLLHTQPHKPGTKSSAKKRAAHDIFDCVPEESLYMLLPLWAGEMDPAMNPSAQTATLPTIPEDRQYLLVWYVPFKGKDKKVEQLSAKKKSKQSQPTPSSNVDTTQKNIFLSNFRVNARLVGYDDLRGSGIRVPSDGLAISAPAWEDINYDAANGDMQMPETVICVCNSRETGFQFQPEGLMKLGLCSQEEITLSTGHIPVNYFFEFQTIDVEHFLTPLGKAAVEMVWLGCLAITSFGPV